MVASFPCNPPFGYSTHTPLIGQRKREAFGDVWKDTKHPPPSYPCPWKSWSPSSKHGSKPACQHRRENPAGPGPSPTSAFSSSATLSERSRRLPWHHLREGKRVGRKRRILAMGHGRSPYLASTPLPAQRPDGEAAWGVGSDGGWVYGYKLHLPLDLDTWDAQGGGEASWGEATRGGGGCGL